MSDIAIRADRLSKRYRIAQPERYRSLRDTVSDGFAKPFRGLAAMFRPAMPQRRDGDCFLWALKDLDLEVHRGEVVGIIGRNGAGKSTLLKLLARTTEPTQGSAEIHGRVGSLLEVGTGFHPELSGRENIYLNGAILGMKKVEIDRKFDEIVAFAEIEEFLDTAVKHYSSGMYVRLAFAVAAHLETEVLLVDEVLAVGDLAFQKKCTGRIGEVARSGRTVLFVSHNMPTVSALCDSGVVLQDAGIAFRGSAAEAVACYNRLATGSNMKHAAAHVLYEGEAQSDFSIVRIEVCTPEGEPKPIVSTWDDFALRVWYRCEQALQPAAVEFEIASTDGVGMALLSTQPDSTLALSFRPGLQAVECLFRNLPLAGGQYDITAALAIPKIKYLWRKHVGVLTVAAHDVYGSGLPPTIPRSRIAPAHQWRVVR